jgi:hypothetical protein
MADVGIELDPEDFNAKGLRKLLKGMKNSSSPHDKRDDESKEKEADKRDKENEDLVDLHREKKGDSKPPKVSKDDLPEELSQEEDEEEDKEKDED